MKQHYYVVISRILETKFLYCKFVCIILWVIFYCVNPRVCVILIFSIKCHNSSTIYAVIFKHKLSQSFPHKINYIFGNQKVLNYLKKNAFRKNQLTSILVGKYVTDSDLELSQIYCYWVIKRK